MIETANLEKKREKNTTTVVAVETTTKEITTDNWKLSETAPSYNDCVATIVTEQFTRTGKGVGTACPAFRKEIRASLKPSAIKKNSKNFVNIIKQIDKMSQKDVEGFKVGFIPADLKTLETQTKQISNSVARFLR